MNRRAKGKRNEAKARKLLQDLGFVVDFKQANMFGSQDFFELYDIMALKKKELWMIQVKSNRSDMYSAKKPIKEFIQKYNPPFKSAIMLAIPYKPFRVLVFNREWIESSEGVFQS